MVRRKAERRNYRLEFKFSRQARASASGWPCRWLRVAGQVAMPVVWVTYKHSHVELTIAYYCYVVVIIKEIYFKADVEPVHGLNYTP
jgi:hypothetical protein